MRLFLAVDLPDNIKSYLGYFQSFFQDMGRFSWVRPELLHITLKFLGEVDEKRVEPIVKKLEDIKSANFSLTLNELGFFTSQRNPRVFWVNFVDSVALRHLSEQVRVKLREFRDDHPFSDHVTLARIKFLRDQQSFFEKVKQTCLDPKEFLVDNFVLYRSTLTKQGSIYEPVKRFDLR